MKKWLVIALLALGGCSSANQSSQLYLLPDSQTLTEQAPKGLPTLVVRPVEFATYLNDSSLVYRTSETQLIQAKQNLWAQSLSKQVTLRVIEQLRAKQHQYWPVMMNPALSQAQQPKLQIQIDRFNGVYTGNAEISGEWMLIDKQGAIQKSASFALLVPLQDEGYPALVDALAKGVNQMTNQIVEQL
ncbi:hypothetical protein DZ860_05105 [Vibrio sinensis]|uniref:ABC-type transport auxiliary lipoprotein component domain-containing protein n=1 Tax=Vibrio sinensis TaxID=2302434 RepID=A0A3A6QMB5_9VIBR|nr:ABC-type transport auxiliary lipoprotein family protein [Vibrio sinensis]RJX73613.1 hypothetical protein DZ860_05105 [Vibrio sinensis]